MKVLQLVIPTQQSLKPSSCQPNSLLKLHLIAYIFKVLMGDFIGNHFKGHEVTNINEDQQDQYRNQAVIGGMTLYQVSQQQMSKKLHHNIAALIWRNNGLVGRGSGVLISPNLVLTSASFLFHQRQQIPLQKIDIYPSLCGALIQPCKVQQACFSKQYLSAENPAQFDYALLKLAQTVQTGNFMQLQAGHYMKSGKFAIFGYPAQKYKLINEASRIETVSQYGLMMNDALIEIRHANKQICYSISTLPGQSGAPVISVEGDKLSIIGIHKGGKSLKQGLVNFGHFITNETISNLEAWRVQMKAEPFQFFTSSYTKEKFDQLNYYVQQGDIFYQAKEYQKSADFYDKAYQINQYQPQLCCKLGSSLKESKKYQQAITYYRQALKLRPQNYTVYSNLGNIYKQLNRTEEAIDCYRKAIQINPSYSKGYYNLGIVLSHLDKHEEVIDCYTKAIQISPQSQQAYNNLGITLQRSGRLQEAIDCYRRALRIRPDGEIFCNLIKALIDGNRNQEATQQLIKFSQANKQSNMYIEIVNSLIQSVNRQEQSQKKANSLDSQPQLSATKKVKILQAINQTNQAQYAAKGSRSVNQHNWSPDVNQKRIS